MMKLTGESQNTSTIKAKPYVGDKIQVVPRTKSPRSKPTGFKSSGLRTIHFNESVTIAGDAREIPCDLIELGKLHSKLGTLMDKAKWQYRTGAR